MCASTMPAPRAAALLLLALALVGPAATAAAQDDPGAYFRAGVDAYDAGNYEAALVSFERSYALNPLPAVLRNIGLAQRALGHHVGAVRSLERYLRETERVDGEVRRAVETELAALAQHVARLTIEVDPGEASVQLDGEDVAVDERNRIVLEPGAHVVTATFANHHDARREVELTAGSVLTVSLALEALDEPQAPVEAPVISGGGPEYIWTFVVGGAALVFGGGALAFWLQGDAALGTLESCRGSCTEADIDESGVRTWDLLHQVSLGLAIAAAAGTALSLVLETFLGGSSAESPRARLRIGPGSVAITGQF